MHASLLRLLVLSLSWSLLSVSRLLSSFSSTSTSTSTLLFVVNAASNLHHATISSSSVSDAEVDAEVDANDADLNAKMEKLTKLLQHTRNPNGDGDDMASMEAFLKSWDAHVYWSDAPESDDDSDHSKTSSPKKQKQFIDVTSIATALGCDESSSAVTVTANATTDPEAYAQIPTDADFALFVESYVVATHHQHARHSTTNNNNNNNNNDDPHKNPKSQRFLRPPSVHSYDPNAFAVPIEVRSIPHIGRGIFASEDIANGTLVLQPKNYMEFYDMETYRDFLAHMIRKKSSFVCDHISWMWGAQKSPLPGDYAVCMSADSTSLINAGATYYEYEDGGEDSICEGDDDPRCGGDDDEYEDYDDEYEDIGEPNIAQHLSLHDSVSGERTIYGCQNPLFSAYATRDIKAGERMLFVLIEVN